MLVISPGFGTITLPSTTSMESVFAPIGNLLKF